MVRKRYENLDAVNNAKTSQDMRRWMKERRSKVKDLTYHIGQSPVKESDRLKGNRSEASITWIGHSTFLIQMNGCNLITDPVWAKRMGLGKRLTEPGLTIEELPEIDIVMISHGHYDHLDFGTIRKLRGNPTFYVPIGLKAAFSRRGYRNVVEAEWWESFEYAGIKLTFVPAQHWTRRSLWDMNTSHWGGWILESDVHERSIYFVGDTGYFRGFAEIRKRFEIDVVLMPIGAYEPEWFMAVSHINPEDAVKAFVELGGKLMIPMHYGAYRLADDTGPEALARLLGEWERIGERQNKLKVLLHGESLWL